MYACHLRTVQGLIADLSLLAIAHSGDLNLSLNRALHRRDDQIDSLRFVDVEAGNRMQARGLLFHAKADPLALSRLILPTNRRPPSTLHLDLPFDGTGPIRVDLMYAATRRQRMASAAHYFFSGALATYPEHNPGYTLIREQHDPKEIERCAELFRVLNLRVDHLPYPEGHKLSIANVLKKSGIRFVGDLIQKSAEELKDLLGWSEWIAIRSILAGFQLQPGMLIPQWRRPIPSE